MTTSSPATATTRPPNPHADMAPRLNALAETIIAQAADLQDQAFQLHDRATDELQPPPKERINILLDRVQTLRYQSRVLEAAAEISACRGTAAELCGIAWVLPAGYTAIKDPQ